MASLFKRGKRYYVRTSVNGNVRDIATKTSNRKLAEKIKQKIEYDNATGVLETATRTRLDDLLTSFVEHLKTRLPAKSVANDVSRLRRLFGPIVPLLETKRPVKSPTDSRLAVPYAEQITPQLINQRLDQRAHDVSPKTLNEEREILHRLCSYAIDFHGMVHPDRRHPNPAAAVKRRRVPAPEIRFLTHKQIEKQLKVLKDHPVIRAAVAIMIYAGVRRSEALWLTKTDVERKRRMIRVCAKTEEGEWWQPKTARNRTVPINTSLAAELDRYRSPQGTPWFLPSPAGCRVDPDNFSHALAVINQKHKFPWSCLDFRHTFGSILAQRGVSLFKISTMMGNSPEICRRHYAALIPDELAGDAEFTDRDPLQLVKPNEAAAQTA